MRTLSLFCFILFSYLTSSASDTMKQKPILMYVFDPMCGWCYGFSPVMVQFQTKHANEFQFSAMSGGMIVGDQQQPIASMRDYIKGAIPHLEKTTGVHISDNYKQNILEKGTYISSSEKPSFAFVHFKNSFPEQSIAFAHELQNLLFQDGLDLNQDSVYIALLKKFGLEPTDFIKEMKSDRIRKQTFDEFKQVGNWGIKGFPAVILFNEGKGYMVSNGYTDLASLESQVNVILKK